MEFIRYVMASLMLLSSDQSMALFMPEGFSIDAEIEAVASDGCIAAPAALGTTAF